MDFGSCLIQHTPSGTGNDVVARFGEQKTSVGWSKGTLGYSNIVCYLPWLIVVFVVSPQDFL